MGMEPMDAEFIRNNPSIFQHRKCVFVVGAGISVPSGIPDFRSPTGIFQSLREQLHVDGKSLFTYNFGIKEGTRQIYLKYIADLKRLCDSVSPNTVHHFLTEYPRTRVYTQNIDGLEERAGMAFTKQDGTRGVYLHGNLSQLNCQYCGYKQPFSAEDLGMFFRAVEVDCKLCLERREAAIQNGTRKRPMGIMHPSIIHYQQSHPDGAFISRMIEKDSDCDLLIVIGTSLKVEGIKMLVKRFSRASGVTGKRIFVNLTKPAKEWSDHFDYFYEGDCQDFVSAVQQQAAGSKVGAKSGTGKLSNKTDKRVSMPIRVPCSTVVSEPVIIPTGKDEPHLRSSPAPSTGEAVAHRRAVRDSRTASSHPIRPAASKCPLLSAQSDENSTSTIHGNGDNQGNQQDSQRRTVEAAIRRLSISKDSLNDIDIDSLDDADQLPYEKSHNEADGSATTEEPLYLSTEKYDSSLLQRGSPQQPEPKIYSKLERLTDTFIKEENISQPILNEILKETEGTRIPPSGFPEDDDGAFLGRQRDTSRMDSEEEIQDNVDSEQDAGPLKAERKKGTAAAHSSLRKAIPKHRKRNRK